MSTQRRGLSAWIGDQRGASAVEFALFAPVLLMLLLGSVTIFHMFRTAQNLEKATYTVGDILSRQTVVSNDVMTNMLSLTTHSVAIVRDGALRVTSISRVGSGLVVDWTKTVGKTAAVGNTALPLSVVPDIANGDSVLVTETFVPYSALVSGFGLDQITFHYRAVQRPRFVGSIVFKN
jgi:Flp pilus assembly protein TadG